MSEIFPELDGVDLPPEKHSRVGIVSFALSILLGIVFFVSFCICVSLTLDAQQNASQGPVPGPELLLPVCFMMGALFASIVPLGLGIGGICEPNSRKLFSILGTVFSRLISGNFRKIRAIQLDFYMICDSLLRKQTNHADRAEHCHSPGRTSDRGRNE